MKIIIIILLQLGTYYCTYFIDIRYKYIEHIRKHCGFDGLYTT